MIPALALALIGLWLLLAFGVRTLTQKRRTGDTGYRFGRGGRQSTAQALMTVAFVLVLAAPIAELADLPVLGAPLWEATAVRVAGLVLIAAGTAATVAAQTAMGTSWRIGVDPGERTTLVTSGPFARVRNPVFSAVGLTALGLALAVPNALAALMLAAYTAGVQLQVRGIEEPYLLEVHGDAYAAYTARVGRFLPGLGRSASGA